MMQTQVKDAQRRAMVDSAFRFGMMPPAAALLQPPRLSDEVSTDLRSDGSLELYRKNSRIPPIRPTTDSIPIWLKRLTSDPKPETRTQAAKQVAEWYNPDMLVNLGAAYQVEKDEGVKAAIEKAAKLIYWNLVYWEMSQDGRLEPAIHQKAASQA